MNLSSILLNTVEISPDLLESKLDLLELVGFVYNIGRVEWLGFWRRKPPLDLLALGLRCGNL